MGFRIELDPRAADELGKLDLQHQRRIVRFLRERVAPLADPRGVGGPLHGQLHELWKYRVGDFRLICDIRDDVLVVLVLRIGHRSRVYRR